ncbi:hypothetical protein JCM8097_003514 [Rhodosporidiobolus ruineniae]
MSPPPSSSRSRQAPSSRSRTSSRLASLSRTATLAALVLLAAAPAPAEAAYSLTKAYQGSDFFDGWSFYGTYDNLTNGDVDYVSASNRKDLAYINGAGNAIVKVDNTTAVIYPNKRRSVRIETKETYPIGSLWVYDMLHLPYGCSVWPSAWSSAPNWPQGGEIDTFEGVNQQQVNRMALHTADGCSVSNSTTSAAYTGELEFGNCYVYSSANSGCGITERNENSYGESFATNGGGVWVTELAKDGVRIWFFPRASVPDDISNSSAVPDPSSWPSPSAFYPSSSCEISNFFAPQHLVLTITLCGDWAGNTNVLNQTGCALTTDMCYTSYVLTSSNYDNAYFEIPSIRVYHNPDLAANSSAAALVGFPSNIAVAGQKNPTSGARRSGIAAAFGAAVLAVGAWTLM